MNKKKKILIVNWRDISNPEAGGAEVHCHEIFKRFDKEKYDISLLSSKYKGCKKQEVIDNITIYRRGTPSLFNYYVYLNIKKIVKRHKFDLIIDDVNKIPFFLPKILKSNKILTLFHHFFNKTIFYETNIFFGFYFLFFERMINTVYKKTPFVAVSKSTFDEFVCKIYNNHPQGQIIHNGIDLEKYTPSFLLKEDNHIVYIGRIKKYKNLDFLIDVAKYAKKRISDLKLTIAGSGDYLKKIKKKNVSNWIKFSGYLSEEEKIQLYQRASLVVNPSFKEGWGITNIEANACGTPVLSSNVSGLRDSVSPGESGYLYQLNNKNDFMIKLEKMLNNKDELRQMSYQSRKWAENFSWDKSFEEMKHVIDKLI